MASDNFRTGAITLEASPRAKNRATPTPPKNNAPVRATNCGSSAVSVGVSKVMVSSPTWVVPDITGVLIVSSASASAGSGRA